MAIDLNTLVRPAIKNLVPYSSARNEYSGNGAILLDANENPFNEPLNRYPDPHQQELKQKLGAIKGIQTDRIFVGNGSDEAIDLLFRIFCEPGVDNVVSISPTYGMYQVCADINNVKVNKALLNADFTLNQAAIKKACNPNTKLLFICSPNNPTSNSFDPAEIIELARKLNLIVVVDEAYIDFSTSGSLLASLAGTGNLVILQTLSKAWGMAGIRVGMAFSNPEIIRYMSIVKYPYNVNSLSIDAAINALENEKKKDEWVELILKERGAMEKKLKLFRFVQEVYHSDANFLLVRIKNARQVYDFLVAKKIIVRDRSKTELCDGCIRITIGTPSQNARLHEALMEYQRKFVESCEI